MPNARNGRLTVFQALLIGLVMALLGVVITMATLGISLHSRVATIEAKVDSQDSRYTVLVRRLDRIETKLDRLIEREGG